MMLGSRVDLADWLVSYVSRNSELQAQQDLILKNNGKEERKTHASRCALQRKQESSGFGQGELWLFLRLLIFLWAHS